jgi:3-oxoacyl-[acyl-carrier-protein] synthase II
MPTASVSIKYGLKGPTISTASACATGLSSVATVYDWIKYGDADLGIAGGS